MRMLLIKFSDRETCILRRLLTCKKIVPVTRMQIFSIISTPRMRQHISLFFTLAGKALLTTVLALVSRISNEM
jgi:hypothetical protein